MWHICAWEDILHKSHNAPVPYPTIHHVGTEICTLLFKSGVFWDMGQVYCTPWNNLQWKLNQREANFFPKNAFHDDVIKWKHLPRYWLFVREIHRWPVIPPHKGQWRGDLMFSLICAWINGWVNNRDGWFETPSSSLWRHCNGYTPYMLFTKRRLFCSSLYDLVIRFRRIS